MQVNNQIEEMVVIQQQQTNWVLKEVFAVPVTILLYNIARGMVANFFRDTCQSRYVRFMARKGIFFCEEHPEVYEYATNENMYKNQSKRK